MVPVKMQQDTMVVAVHDPVRAGGLLRHLAHHAPQGHQARACPEAGNPERHQPAHRDEG
ncbi:MAG: hypothetical protein M0C28_22515 [Candidatus Moduliflexus flocculans]|nr:hypothetical protein [Candidatus Moduliflexus flocculans]